MWQNTIIMSVVFSSLLLIFELIQQAALVNFMLFLNIFKILKISCWSFWRKSCISLVLWAFFSIKPCKAFRVAQCKQPRLLRSKKKVILFPEIGRVKTFLSLTRPHSRMCIRSVFLISKNKLTSKKIHEYKTNKRN